MSPGMALCGQHVTLDSDGLCPYSTANPSLEDGPSGTLVHTIAIPSVKWELVTSFPRGLKVLCSSWEKKKKKLEYSYISYSGNSFL